MSITDHVETVEQLASYVTSESGALLYCGRHATAIRVGEEDKEKHAYALANTILTRQRHTSMRKDVMDAIKDELENAADETCPGCDEDRAS